MIQAGQHRTFVAQVDQPLAATPQLSLSVRVADRSAVPGSARVIFEEGFLLAARPARRRRSGSREGTRPRRGGVTSAARRSQQMTKWQRPSGGRQALARSWREAKSHYRCIGIRSVAAPWLDHPHAAMQIVRSKDWHRAEPSSRSCRPALPTELYQGSQSIRAWADIKRRITSHIVIATRR